MQRKYKREQSTGTPWVGAMSHRFSWALHSYKSSAFSAVLFFCVTNGLTVGYLILNLINQVSNSIYWVLSLLGDGKAIGDACGNISAKV